METLCVLSDQGLKYTILAPWQVRSVDGQPGPYLVDLPGGRKPFIVFPYQRELSTMVSFIPNSTQNGDQFLNIVREKVSYDHCGLNIIASDGELYGHHQKSRDLFLNYIVNSGEERPDLHWTIQVNGFWRMRLPPEQCWFRLRRGLVSRRRPMEERMFVHPWADWKSPCTVLWMKSPVGSTRPMYGLCPVCEWPMAFRNKFIKVF